jgi:hypothetical protein
VDDHNGDVVGGLQLAQVAEDGGHMPRIVLVDAMQTPEGVEHEQPG